MGNLSNLLQPSVAVQPSALANAGAELGMRNRIINGAMAIDQRNAGASVTIGSSSSAYTLDRWGFQCSQASKISVQQNAGAVTPPAGFAKYLGVTSLSAYTAASNEFFEFVQTIEGLNVADLAWGTADAQSVTVSFWVRSSITGTHSGAVLNNTGTRSYAFSFTVSAQNTWEYKTITIPGDTTGTWGTTNTTGTILRFDLGSGSSYRGTAGVWAASNLNGVTGAVSIIGTNGATFYITGVQFEKGSTATPFEWRSYGQELALCQRYYYRMTYSGVYGSNMSVGVGTADSATSAAVYVSFPVTMRYPPYALETNGTAANYGVRYAGPVLVACSSVPSINNWDAFGARVTFPVASGLTAGQAVMGTLSTAGAYLAFSAEI